MRAGRFEFPKTMRLLKRQEYLRVAQTPIKAHTRHFLFLWAPNLRSTCRIGITVTRKVANSVGRNRVKRRVREAFRLCVKDRLPSGDLVVIAKRGAGALHTSQVAAEYQQGLKLLKARHRSGSK